MLLDSNPHLLSAKTLNYPLGYRGIVIIFIQISDSTTYFIPQAPTLALPSSRKDVKHLVYFQILQNADNIFLLSDNSAVILFPKV